MSRRVVLDDHCRLQIGRDLLHALKRGDSIATMKVERRHAVALVVFVEMREVAHQEKVAGVLQAYQCAKAATLAPGIGGVAVMPSQSPLPIITCAPGQDGNWPVWSG